MNTPEKYVCAYIVEALTGVKGTNQERVYEVLREGDFMIENPLLKLVYGIARFDPESEEIKRAVVGLVAGYAYEQNESFRELFDLEQETPEEEVEPEITLTYTLSEGKAIICLTKGEVEMYLRIPKQYLDYTIKAFQTKFPNGKVVQK